MQMFAICAAASKMRRTRSEMRSRRSKSMGRGQEADGGWSRRWEGRRQLIKGDSQEGRLVDPTQFYYARMTWGFQANFMHKTVL